MLGHKMRFNNGAKKSFPSPGAPPQGGKEMERLFGEVVEIHPLARGIPAAMVAALAGWLSHDYFLDPKAAVTEKFFAMADWLEASETWTTTQDLANYFFHHFPRQPTWKQALERMNLQQMVGQTRTAADQAAFDVLSLLKGQEVADLQVMGLGLTLGYCVNALNPRPVINCKTDASPLGFLFRLSRAAAIPFFPYAVAQLAHIAWAEYGGVPIRTFLRPLTLEGASDALGCAALLGVAVLGGLAVVEMLPGLINIPWSILRYWQLGAAELKKIRRGAGEKKKL